MTFSMNKFKIFRDVYKTKCFEFKSYRDEHGDYSVYDILKVIVQCGGGKDLEGMLNHIIATTKVIKNATDGETQ